MESVVETPETAKVDTSPPTDVPAQNNETPAVESASPQGPDSIAVYQDIVAKFNEDPTYDMTDTESDIFLEVQDRIQSKEIEEPIPRKLDSKSTPEPEKDAKPETPPEGTDTGEKPAEDVKSTGDSVNDNMLKAMGQVGAKDVTELPGKIEALIKNRDDSGGRLGDENASLKKAVDDFKTEKANHVAWLNALKAGDPEAIKYLTDNVGYVPNSSTHPQPNVDEGLDINPGEFGDADEFLDDKLAGFVKSQNSKIEAQAEQIKELLSRDKKREDQVQQSQASNSYVDDVVNLVTSPENQKAYGLTAVEARGLAEFYFSDKQKDTPIHPKFQKVHELILFAYEKQMPTLADAHVIHHHKSGNFAKELVNATKNGQQEFTPSANTEMSEMQSRQGNNLPDPMIQEEDVSNMEKGDFSQIPDSWTDKSGTLLPEKVPKRFHEQAFGRVIG